MNEYVEGVDKFTHDDCVVYVERDMIEVWYDPEHHQDIPISEDAVEMLKEGADPVGLWEDGNGNTVCYENSEELRE